MRGRPTHDDDDDGSTTLHGRLKWSVTKIRHRDRGDKDDRKLPTELSSFCVVHGKLAEETTHTLK